MVKHRGGHKILCAMGWAASFGKGCHFQGCCKGLPFFQGCCSVPLPPGMLQWAPPPPGLVVLMLQGHRWAAPTYFPKGSEILLIAVFVSSAPERRSGIPRQPAWACRGSRIPVLGCISCTDTSKQRFLPTQAMEAANNPGMPRLCTAQLSASCLFLRGCSATGREHFLAIIKKRNCADRSS